MMFSAGEQGEQGDDSIPPASERIPSWLSVYYYTCPLIPLTDLVFSLNVVTLYNKVRSFFIYRPLVIDKKRHTFNIY